MYRVEKIVIETPKPGENPFLGVTIQKVIFDEEGNVKEIIPRHDIVHTSGDRVAQNIFTYLDPLTRQHITLSGYAIWLGLLRMSKNTIENTNRYKIDDDGNLVDE